MQSKSMRISKTEHYYLALLKPICPWAVREDPRPFYTLWRRFNGQGQLCHLTLACENISAKREEKRMPSQANLTYEGGRETIPERAQFSPGGKKKKRKKEGGEGGGGGTSYSAKLTWKFPCKPCSTTHLHFLPTNSKILKASS